jgi:hypothetical protein
VGKGLDLTLEKRSAAMFKKKKTTVKLANYESGYRRVTLYRKGVQEYDFGAKQYKWVSMYYSVIKYYPTCGVGAKKVWEETQIDDFGVANVRTEIDRQRTKVVASKHYFAMVKFAMEMEQIEEVNHLNRLSAILEATKAITSK